MPSSTSSSRRRFWLTIALLALAILAGYDVLVSRGFVPPSEGITAYQANQIRAQRYVDGDVGDPEVVMCGTSLTDNIRADYVGPGVYNLGFSGGSTATGLRLVALARTTPKVALVEVNDVVGRVADEDFIRAVTAPQVEMLHRLLPITRIEYQPVSVVVNALKKRGQARMGSVAARDRALSNADPAVHRELVARMERTYAVPLSTEERAQLTQAIDRLKADIRRLNARGIRVVLHTIPGDQELAGTVRARQLTALFHAQLPAGQFEWLPAPPARDWLTRDGVHLTKEDAGVYGEYIRRELGSVLDARAAGRSRWQSTSTEVQHHYHTIGG